jgi:hypothetical protein
VRYSRDVSSDQAVSKVPKLRGSSSESKKDSKEKAKKAVQNCAGGADAIQNGAFNTSTFQSQIISARGSSVSDVMRFDPRGSILAMCDIVEYH